VNYTDTLDYLYTRLPLFSRVGAAALKPDLTNTLEICKQLNNPQENFKSIHIAGTNGKGSVSHMLAAVLQQAGYKTGLYTSPHLKDFRERIRVNGEMISEEYVITFTEKIKPTIEAISPSFFEITVGMAFAWFADQSVDIAIIETGLGGRLDSTNVITPLVSVITNIGWDHMDLLGDTLEKIAVEKAGIIKQNVPVVVGEIVPETLQVFEYTAAAKQTDLFIAPQQRQVMEWKWEKHELIVSVAEPHKTDHSIYHLDLPGIYQLKNLPTVLETIHQLQQQGWIISHEAIHQGLRQVKKLTGLHGRWDIIHEHPLIVLDVAHNEDGMRQVTEQLELMTYDQLHIIVGMVKDKDIDNVLALLPAKARYYFTQAAIPRALPAGELREKASWHQLEGDMYPNVNAALQTAKEKATAKDLILVAGSVFLVGEVER